MRLAIVGLGPKGLFALERLLHHAAHLDPGVGIEVDAYEPSQVPGAGPVYAPDQPPYLRMNFRAEHVNLWPPGSRAIPRAEQRSFDEWRDPAEEPYAARAEVGLYLADGLDRLLEHAPGNFAIRITRSHVTGLRRQSDGLVIEAAGESRIYDEVLLATGHEQQADSALARSWRSPVPLIAAVFPTGAHLSEDRVPAGSTVAARGFALTFIDAALALTEGRGGRFEMAGTTRLRYVGTDQDVGRLVPYSRTGRPLLAKPALPENLDHTDVRAARERIAVLPDGFGLRDGLLPIISDVAAAFGGHESTLIAEVLAGASEGTPPVTRLTPKEELGRSLDIALGEAEPDLPAALGFAWRGVYPALVARLGFGGLDASQWPAFRRLCVTMERIAFGPSPTNVMKLLALIDAGKVDLSELRASSWRAIEPVDAVVDTVLAAPGAAGARSALIRRLLADGYARIPAQQRGLEVLPDGACVGRDGSVTEGLSAIGRPTEDSVIGNDTLSRTLHPAADQWARRIVATVSVAVPEAVL